MKLRQPSSRWAVWLFASALLLKAWMPLLASASADAQGKPLVEVCTVYGMSMVAAVGDQAGAGTGQIPASDDVSAHLDHHCALSALAAFFVDAPPALGLPGVAHRVDPQRLEGSPHQVPDAAATWVARLKHGPPRLS